MNNTEYVYVLSNRSLKTNLLKIGYTKINPYVRAYQLSKSTGVPFSYDVEYVINVCNGKKLETQIHEHMQNYRYNKDREFFQIDKFKLKDIFSCDLCLSFNHKFSNDANFKDEITKLKNENIKLKSEKMQISLLQNKIKENTQNNLSFIEQIGTLKCDLYRYIDKFENEKKEKNMLAGTFTDKIEQVATLKEDINRNINKLENAQKENDISKIEILRLRILIFYSIYTQYY